MSQWDYLNEPKSESTLDSDHITNLSVQPGNTLTEVLDNQTVSFTTGTLQTDNITELTPGQGITIEDVNLNDGEVGLNDQDSSFRTYLRSVSTNTADRTLTIDVENTNPTLRLNGSVSLNQSLTTTSNPLFNQVQTTAITDKAGSSAPNFPNGLILSSGDILSTYIEDTHVSTLFGPWASPINFTINIRKIGDLVTLQWSNALDTATIADEINLTDNLPAAYRPPGNGMNQYLTVRDNGTLTLGRMSIETTGQFRIWLDTLSNFSGAGSTGVISTSVTYLAQ